MSCNKNKPDILNNMFGYTLFQVKFKLSDCATHLFALESAIYMSAGLADYQVKLT